MITWNIRIIVRLICALTENIDLIIGGSVAIWSKLRRDVGYLQLVK